MTTIRTKTRTNTKSSAGIPVLGTGAVVIAAISVWSLANLVSALVTFGPVELAKGFVTAITGV